MFRVLGIAFFVLLGGLILIISIFRSSAPTHAFYQPVTSTAGQGVFVSGVEYYFPYPGVLPGHPLYSLKALRDQFWLLATSDPMKKAETLLLFADKRIQMAKILLKEGKASQGVATAVKAEQYLVESYEESEKASTSGTDTIGFCQRMANASLKHREELEEMVKYAPEDARPLLAQVMDHPKKVYEECFHRLNERGIKVPGSSI